MQDNFAAFLSQMKNSLQAADRKELAAFELGLVERHQVTIKWHIGDVIRKLRGSESQTAFGRRVGVSRPTLSRIESKGTGHHSDTIGAIARELNLEVSELHQAVPPKLNPALHAVVVEYWRLDEKARSAFLVLMQQAIEKAKHAETVQ